MSLPSVFRRRPSALAALFGVLILIGFVPAALQAQATGHLNGRVVDAASGAGLPDAGVQLVGTTIGTRTDAEGRFVIPNLPAGTVTLHVRRLGYRPQTVTGLYLNAGATLEHTVSLDASAVQLMAQQVTASARGSVDDALQEQKDANKIVNAITREQIARSPDSDAAQAVQRVSGVTVQDGKYVFVRGLGERYTATSLNGARLPSPEPERKVVPLDLFPSALLQSVTTSKTFTPDQAGDFSGALVDIRTREFPAKRETTFSLSTGINDAAFGSTVLASPTAGQEWLGFGGGVRQLPSEIAAAGGFQQAFTQDEINRLVRSFRNVWSPRRTNGMPNTSAGASIGGNEMFLGRRIGFVAAGSYAFAQEVRDGEERSQAELVGTSPRPLNTFTGSTGRTSVLWGGLLNLSTLVGTTRFALDNTYNRTADLEAHIDSGFYESDNLQIRRTTLRFVERTVRSSQLRADHAFGRQTLDWSLTSSGVSRKEPDRADHVYNLEPSSGRYVLFAGSDGARRTFSTLDENNLSAALNHRFVFGTREHAVKTGLSARGTWRTADNLQYSLQPRLSAAERELAAEEIFDGRFAEPGDDVFSLQPLGGGGSYEADDRVGAAYAMLDYAMGTRVRVITGARVEHAEMNVRTVPLVGTPLESGPRTTDVLPSLAITYTMTPTQQLRASASQTLARPEYREVSAIISRDVLGGQSLIGNPQLQRSLIQNADLRWEWYPNAGEVISVGVFAKRFENPIERVEVATSGQSSVTFVNAGTARTAGVELELRKGLGGLFEGFEPLTVFTNTTLMWGEISTGNSELSASSSANRPMVGQAPYVVNAGVTYASPSGALSATALYNVVGKRIAAAGTRGYPNIYEQPRHVVDLALRFPLFDKLSAKIDAKNLLDTPYEQLQGDVVRERYLAGRVYTVGLTWRP